MYDPGMTRHEVVRERVTESNIKPSEQSFFLTKQIVSFENHDLYLVLCFCSIDLSKVY